MSFNELFESAYSQDLHHQPRKFVEFYNHNRILIEGQNTSKSDLVYDRVTRLITDYAHCLTSNESYTKAGPEIEKALTLFENHPEYQGEDLLEIKYYEVLLFDRAVVNYYTKHFEEAIEDLTKLSSKFPEDEKFKKWLSAAKSYKLMKLGNVFYILIIVTLIADIFLDGLNPILDTGLTIMLAIFLSIIGIVELIKWKKKNTT